MKYNDKVLNGMDAAIRKEWERIGVKNSGAVLEAERRAYRAGLIAGMHKSEDIAPLRSPGETMSTPTDAEIYGLCKRVLAITCDFQEDIDARAEAVSIIESLRAERAELRLENESLRGFVGGIFNDYSEAWGSDLDGLRVQEIGLACGLLHKVTMTQEMHDSLDCCSNCDGDCDECYRFTPLTQSCVNNLREHGIGGIKP